LVKSLKQELELHFTSVIEYILKPSETQSVEMTPALRNRKAANALGGELLTRLLGRLFPAFFLTAGCLRHSGEEGSPAFKIFFALGICIAAIFLVFFLVVKSRKKE
jgi:hypothetical protein